MFILLAQLLSPTSHARLASRTGIGHVDLVAELIRNVLAGSFFKHIPGLVGDLLIHGARFSWIDFALTEFLLDGIHSLVKIVLLWLAGLSLVVHFDCGRV